MKKRVAVVASHVIQYQDPFFRLLAAEPEIDLTVLYGSRAGLDVYRDEDMGTSLRWDIPLLEGYRSEFLHNFGFGEGYTRSINPGVMLAIVRGRFDAVILMQGWGTITSLLAMAACRATGTPIFLFGDSAHPPPETTLARKVRGRFLRTVTALTSRFLVSGFLNADYYAYYGGDRKNFFSVPWAIDNDRFAEASRFAPGEREAMRARFGIRPGDVAFVFSAKLIPRKDPMTLLSALAQMKERHRAALVFLGDGELRPQLEAFVREQQLERVAFAGFVNQTELPKHYSMADVFVLPSLYEPRGSVINEAMACGLPVIVSDVVGAVGDIVRDGENGYVFPSGDAAQLAAAMDRLAGDALRARMAERSRELIGAWDFRAGVRGVLAAVRSLP